MIEGREGNRKTMAGVEEDAGEQMITRGLDGCTLVTLNCNGLRETKKKMKLKLCLEEIVKTNKNRIVVVALQETHIRAEVEWVFKNIAGTHQRWSEVNSREGGVAFLMLNVKEEWKRNCTVSFVEIEKGLVLALVVEDVNEENSEDMNEENWEEVQKETKKRYSVTKNIVVNVYATPERKEEILNKTVKWIKETKEKCNKKGETVSVTVIGDLNMVASTKMDRGGEKTRSMAEERMFQKFCEEVEVEDAVRRWLGDNRRVYTFVRGSGQNIQMSRIDHVLLDKFTRANKIEIKPVGFSDHKIVIVECQKTECRPKPPYWKMNSGLLKYDRKVVEEILWCWKENLSEQKRKKNYKLVKIMWEKMKKELKNMYVKVGLEVGRVKREEKEEAIRKMEEAETTNSKDGEDEEKRRGAIYKEAKENLSKMEEIEADIVSTRRKKRWLQESNRSSKYMFRFIDKERGGSTIGTVKGRNDESIKDKKEVRETIAQFYEELFSSDQTSTRCQQEFFEDNDEYIPRLSESTAKDLEAPINVNEVREGISMLGGDKSPGSDGIVIEFYKEFEDVMGDILLIVFQAMEETASASITLREAIIMLIYKKGDPEDIKNWRPISLMNNDYKILTRVLATRLQRCFVEIVDECQTNGSGRNIVNSVVLMKRIMEDVEMKKWIVIFFDQEKAFDRINHRYLIMVLERMGFGQKWIKWIELLYRDAFCKINVNGVLTRKITIKTGVRQGDPISPMLYVLALEPLLRVLRRKTAGIELSGVRIHYNAFADDIATVSESVEDAEKTVEIIVSFVNVANAKINMNKCERIHSDCIDVSNQRFLSVVKYVEKTKYLGCILAITKKQRVESNRLWWKDRIESIEKGLRRWKGCGLDIKGRILVSKALGMGKAMYHTALMNMEKDQVEELQKALDEFIWCGKRAWMNKRERYRPKDSGGLGCVHVQSMIDAMKAQWIVRILHPEENHPVYLVALEEIKKKSMEAGVELDVIVDQRTRWRAAQGLAETFVELLEANSKIRWEDGSGTAGRPTLQRDELRAKRLWRNPDLTGVPFWNEAAWRAGYHRVGDLIEEQDGQARWIRREDINQWIKADVSEKVWRCLNLIIEAVKDRMAHAPLAQRTWTKGDLLASKDEPDRVLVIESTSREDEDQQGENGRRRCLRGVVATVDENGGKILRTISLDCRIDKIATCTGLPIGVMERVSLNPDHWRARMPDVDGKDRWVDMSSATVRALYQAILVGSKTIDEGGGPRGNIKWTKVWDPWMTTKHQIWVFRYLHDRLFVGRQMAHAGARVCVLGCGVPAPNSQHYTRSCSKWDWLWEEKRVQWKQAIAQPFRIPRDSNDPKLSKIDCQRIKYIVMISVSYALYRYTLKVHFEHIEEINLGDVKCLVKTEMESYAMFWDRPRMREPLRILKMLV